MADDKQKSSHSDDHSEDAEGLQEKTGQIEDEATRQISGDALEQIRESAGHDMAPEWLAKVGKRKEESKQRKDQDFDTPVPTAINPDGTPQTDQMDPDDIGKLTEGMNLSSDDSEPDLGNEPPDSDNTKAINRGELDTLMKEREAELGQQDSNVTAERPAPGAGVMSRAKNTRSTRPNRDVNDDPAAAVEEADEETQGSLSAFSLPKPDAKDAQDPNTRSIDDEGLDKDSFGDFSDEDLHAVVFGDDEQHEPDAPKPRAHQDEQTTPAPPAEESPALDFSDISTEDEVAQRADEEQPEETQAGEQIGTPLDEAALPDVSGRDEETGTPEPSGSEGEAEEVKADFPEDFPDYDFEPKRPLIAAISGFFAALAWIVGGALAMFTSIASPWASLVPPIALGAGIVTFLLVLVGAPKWIEASILATLGIGIGGFAFIQWSHMGSVSVNDILGMAPLVGAGLALVAAIFTLIRRPGYVEELRGPVK